jgi:hypothetical protein
MRTLWGFWKAYWFFPSPLVNLAICRILIVGTQIYFMFVRDRLNQLMLFGELPDALYKPWPVVRLFTLPWGWEYRPELSALLAIFWLTMFFGVLALIGLRTNSSLFLFATGTLFLKAFLNSFGYYLHHEPLPLIALGLLAFSPAGQVLSVDSWWQGRRTGQQRSWQALLTETSRYARWPLLLIQWLFSLIYLSAAFHKLIRSGLDWMNGSTMQYTVLSSGVIYNSDFSLWVGQEPMLALFASWFTILFEATFVLAMVFPALAIIYLPAGAALHLGIYLTIHTNFFQWIVLYAVFVPWAALITRVVTWRLSVFSLVSRANMKTGDSAEY